MESNRTQIPNRDSIKKFYIQPDDKTKVLDNKSLPEFVSEVISKSINDANKLIKATQVTVNGEIIIDENYSLKSGDIVRVGVLGHFLQGPTNIAIVK